MSDRKITIRLQESTVRTLRKLAEANDESVSRLVRQAIRWYLILVKEGRL